MQIGGQAVDFCVADVCAVEEGDEVEECEPGDQLEVEFADQLFVLVENFVSKTSYRDWGEVGLQLLLFPRR